MVHSPSKKRILVIADYCRADILYYFEELRNELDIYFIYYSYEKDSHSDLYKQYGTILFYHSFRSAFHLLKKIKPEKVLFFDLETFNQVATLAASRELNIKTFHVEHGFRSYELSSYLDSLPVPASEDRSAEAGPLLHRLRNRFFFMRSALRSSLRKKLLAFARSRKYLSVFESHALLGELALVPETYISFSPRIFDFHRQILRLNAHPDVRYIGFLHSDKFFHGDQFTRRQTKKILFIDSGLHCFGFFGADEKFTLDFYSDMNSLCQKYGYSLTVKTHPIDKSDLIIRSGVRVINEAELIAELPDYSLLAGDYSTLFLILMGFSHMGSLCFWMFPEKGIDPTKFLQEYEVTQAVHTFDEFESLLKNEAGLNAMYEHQQAHRQKYISDYLYKFDGKCRERFTGIILS